MSKVQVDTIVDKDDISAPSLTKGAIVTGICTATSFDGAISEWVLGANGSSDYTFTGSGLTGAENDPTLYLKRGQKYRFKNSSGGHPFRIQSTANGSTGTAYNDGVTNNDAGNGTTLEWDVQFDAPSVLYYQCTAHGSMGGKIYIGNSGNSSTLVDLNVSGVTTTGSVVSGAISGSTGTFTGDVSIADKIIHTGDTNTAIRFPAADTITAETGGSERLRIDSAGLVGMGKASGFAYQLELQRNAVGLLRINNSGESSHGSHDAYIIAGGSYYQNPLIGGSTIKFNTFDGSAFAERVRINSGGQVLIGTDTNPAYTNRRLTVATDNSGGTTAIEIRSATNGDGRIIFTDSTTSGDAGAYKGQIKYDQTDDYVAFYTNGNSERLRIGSAGQLGIAGANYGTAGQVLTSGGASAALSWATAAAGGLTEVDAWTLSGSWPLPNSTGGWVNDRLGNAANVAGTGTLSRNAENNMPLGTGMTNTNGLFTFPSSGTWQVDCQLYLERYSSAVCEGLQVSLSGDKDGSSGSLMSVEQDINQYVNHSVINLTGIIKFTNTATTNFYVKLTAATQVYIKALSASQNIIFKKLA